MADDTDAFLDSLGKRGPPAEPAKSHDDTDAFLDSLGTPTAGEKSWPQTIRGWTDPTPVFKGAAGELEQAAELIPGIKGSRPAEAAKAWAESGQDEETAGGFKRGVGQALPFIFQPELGLGRAALAAAPAVAARAGRVGQLAASAFPTLGHFAERAATGAISGTVQDPSASNIPFVPSFIPQGAITGALGGIAPTSLNMLVQNPATQYMLRHHASRIAGGAAAAGLNHILGPLGFLAYPAAVRGRVGRGIDAAGHWIADGYGRVVGFIPERVARAIAAAGGTTASQTFGGGDGQETSQADQTQGNPNQTQGSPIHQ